MKFNWGTGIVLAFVLFISFIMYFVIEVQSNSKYDNELVVEDYYVHDSKFQDEMARIQSAHDLKEKPIITTSQKGLSVKFPSFYESKNVKGTIAMYRPSNKKFDFNVPLKLENSEIGISQNKLIKGRWELNMEWQYEGKKYLTKKVIYIN